MTVLTYPNAILRQKAKPVEEISNELVLTAQEMMKLMLASNGVGLAAPQVGISQRFIVIDTTAFDPKGGMKAIMFNPEIIHRGTTMLPMVEGCLSLPGVQQPTCRISDITVQYVNEYKQVIHITLRGITAVCVQHEIEHLDGVLLIDYRSKK
jgi:peptide deformylase